ncbi:MAG: N-6 DNA methylase [Chthoniobacterales bacterium]
MNHITQTNATGRNQGQVFSPQPVVNQLLSLSGLNPALLGPDNRVLDPACGEGAILLGIARLIMETQPPDTWERHFAGIWGYDTDKDAVDVCRAKLADLTGWHGWEANISHQNALEMRGDLFRWVIANPPYVRTKNMDEPARALCRTFSSCKKGNIDLYLAFIEHIAAISENSVIICPRTVMDSKTATQLRKLLVLSGLIERVFEHDQQLFPNAAVATACLVLNKTKHTSLTLEVGGKSTSIPYSNLENGEAWIAANKETYSGKKLSDICTIRSGIQTSADDIYVIQPADGWSAWDNGGVDSQPIQVSCKGGTRELERGALRVVVKASLKENSEGWKSLLVFPYETGADRKPRPIAEEDFEARYPKAYAYLEVHRTTLGERKMQGPWYSFARSQALNHQGAKVTISTMADIGKGKNPYASIIPEEFYLRGDAAFPNAATPLVKLRDIFASPAFFKHIAERGTLKANEWRSFGKEVIHDFRLNEPQEETISLIILPLPIQTYLFPANLSLAPLRKTA